jgi:hypothetical protein
LPRRMDRKDCKPFWKSEIPYSMTADGCADGFREGAER